MNDAKKAVKAVNDALKFVGEEPIQLPKDGTTAQKLEAILECYTDRLIVKCPHYRKIKDRREIPDLVVMYLKSMMERQKRA